ncbi:MAG: DUF1707 domain-containing protein [Acidipropionibacterium sp.]|jgi:hypothetical protein|nr:DUF1707 domain-containing protein [Acidipropionibacterium sp.]
MTADEPRIRAGFADRDATLSRLGDAYAAGYLDQQEFDERSSRATTARFRDDLVPLTGDLPQALAINDHDDAAVPATRVRVGELDAVASHENIVAVFGGANRDADWIAPSTANLYTVFGGVELDLSRCVWPAGGHIEVNCFIAFGGAEIRVPEGVRVINHVVPIFGGAATEGLRPARTGPVLELTGVALFGGISVTGPDGRRDQHGPWDQHDYDHPEHRDRHRDRNRH